MEVLLLHWTPSSLSTFPLVGIDGDLFRKGRSFVVICSLPDHLYRLIDDVLGQLREAAHIQVVARRHHREISQPARRCGLLLSLASLLLVPATTREWTPKLAGDPAALEVL